MLSVAAGSGPDLDRFFDEFEAALVAPGQWSPVALMRAAAGLLEAVGRPVVIAEVHEWPHDLQRRLPFRRPREWTGERLVLPARPVERAYQRLLSSNGEWGVIVRTSRPGPSKGQPLGRRQHPALQWTAGERYDYMGVWGPWGIPDMTVLTRLGTAVVADAVDLTGGATGPLVRRHKLQVIGTHFAGDVIWPHGDREWSITSNEVHAWLKMHRYINDPKHSQRNSPSITKERSG